MPTAAQIAAQRRRAQAARNVRTANNPVNQSLLNVGVQARAVGTVAFFIYEFDAVALATSGTGTSVVQIQADATFELQRLAFQAYVTGTVDTALVTPPVLIQISDTSSGANLFNAAVPLYNIAYGGAGFGPFDLPESRYFAPNASVQISLTNLSAANAITVRLNMQGRKLYPQL